MSGKDLLDELLMDDVNDAMGDEEAKLDEHQDRDSPDQVEKSVDVVASVENPDDHFAGALKASMEEKRKSSERKEGRIINLNRVSHQNTHPLQSTHPHQHPSSTKTQPNRPTRYFIIRSINQRNLDISVHHGAWATLRRNERKLNDAFSRSEEVILIFSVNGSGMFQGFARMTTPTGQLQQRIEWDQGEHYQGRHAVDIGEPLGVEWKVMHPLSYSETEHLKNPLNDNKPVRYARDCQEVPADIGAQLVQLMQDAAARSGARPPKDQVSNRPNRPPRRPQQHGGPGGYHEPGPIMHPGPRFEPPMDGFMQGMGDMAMGGMGGPMGVGPQFMPPGMPAIGLGPGPGMMMSGFNDPMSMAAAAHSRMMMDGMGGMGMRPPGMPYPGTMQPPPPAPPPPRSRPTSSMAADHPSQQASVGLGLGGIGGGGSQWVRPRSRSRSRSPEPGPSDRVRSPVRGSSPGNGRGVPHLMDMTYDEYLEHHKRIQRRIQDTQDKHVRRKEQEHRDKEERDKEREREQARALDRQRDLAQERDRQETRSNEMATAAAAAAAAANPLLMSMFGMPGMPGVAPHMGMMNPMMAPGMAMGMQMGGMGMHPYSEAEYIRVCQTFFTSQGRPPPSEDFIRHYYRMQRQQQIGM